MRTKDTLEQYLINLNRDAQEMYELLIKQYAEKEGIVERLKEKQPKRMGMQNGKYPFESY